MRTRPSSSRARSRAPDQGVPPTALLDMLQHTPIERLLERMASSIDGTRAAGLTLRSNLVFSDLQECHVLELGHAVLHHRRGPPAADATATLTLTKPFFLRMMTGQAGAQDLLLSDQTTITGSRIDLGRFFALIEKSPGTFPIVTR